MQANPFALNNGRLGWSLDQQGRSQHQGHPLPLKFLVQAESFALRTGFVNDTNVSFLYRGLVCSRLRRNGNICLTVQLSSEETMYADRWPAFYEAQKYLTQLSHSEVDWKSMCLGPLIKDIRWGTCSWVCGMECAFLDTSFSVWDQDHDWYLEAFNEN